MIRVDRGGGFYLRKHLRFEYDVKSMDNQNEQQKLRIDKWLWAARFFKTRALAADAIECGKALVNGVRVKSAKLLTAGDILTLRLGPYQYVIEVLALSGKRALLPRRRSSIRKRKRAACGVKCSR